MSSPSFWNRNQEEISRISQELSLSKEKIKNWEDTKKQIEDLYELAQIILEEGDQEEIKEISSEIEAVSEKIRKMEIESLFKDPDDRKNSIVSINAGAGGTDAQDWAQMLLRMYLRWCERKGFRTEILDMLPGDEAGLKSVTFSVKGPYALSLIHI